MFSQYLAHAAVQRFVLGHELVQKDFEGVDPNFDRRLAPVSLLLTHVFLQDLLKEGIEVLITNALPIVHLHIEQKTIHLILIKQQALHLFNVKVPLLWYFKGF